MVKYVPLVAIVIVAISSIWRIIWVKKTAGGSAWAFGSARGLQQLAGISFAISIAALLIAAILYARFGGQNLYAAYTGSLLCVIGAAIVIIAQIQMGNSWRIGIDEEKQTPLVQTGLFRFSRNPIFLGMIVTIFGFFLTIPNAFTLVILLIGFVLIQIQVRLEEEFLSKMHDGSYDDYSKEVRRWL